MPTGCPDENTLLNLVGGKVTAESRTQLNAHLDACEACRTLMASMIRSRRSPAGPSDEPGHRPRDAAAATRVDGRGPAHPPGQPLFERGVMVGNRYRLDAFLTEGGMSEVWRAHDKVLDIDVIVKFLSSELGNSRELRSRFAREAKAAARLRSHHVVTVYGHDLHKNVPYIAMELLEGEDLDAHLQRVKRMPLDQASEIATQIARGITSAHAQGIVHRDLKPSNVFLARVDGDEVVKILDFGLAKTPTTASATALTRTGQVMGTLQYMSPEQAIGDGFIDYRSDLWSFAMILFRMITGRDAIPGESVTDAINRILAGDIPKATEICSDLPPEVDAFFARAFALRRENRFPSAEEMAAAFKSLAGQPAGSAAHREVEVSIPPTSDISPVGLQGTAPAARSLRSGLAVASVVVICIGVGAALAWSARSPRHPANAAEGAPPPVSGIVPQPASSAAAASHAASAASAEPVEPAATAEATVAEEPSAKPGLERLPPPPSTRPPPAHPTSAPKTTDGVWGWE